MNALTQKFLDRRGISLVKGNGGDIMLPFYLAILHWDLFATHLKGVGEKHELLRTKNLWREKIQSFVGVAMNTYSMEEFDEEYMLEIDKFTEYINEELDATRDAVKGCLPIDDERTLEVVSNVMLSNILIQLADKMWRGIFKRTNIDLLAMDRLSTKYARLYFPCREDIDLNQSEALSNSVVVLVKKILKYIDSQL